MRNCIICGATNSKLYGLVKGPLRKEWLHNCGISDEKNLKIKNVFFCEIHFKPGDFYKKKVKPGVIPTQNLRVKNPIKNYLILERNEKKNNKKCSLCVFSQRFSSHIRIMLGFPKNKDSRTKWLTICNLPDTTDTNKIFICSIHFPAEAINHHRLISREIFPTLHLTKEKYSGTETALHEEVTADSSISTGSHADNLVEHRFTESSSHEVPYIFNCPSCGQRLE